MPPSPTPAQSSASRANGALSRGPATPEGRARAAANAPVRHGLRSGEFRLLPGEDEAEFAALRDDLLARHAPLGAAERHWVARLAAAAWRARRLDALDELALTAPLAAAAGAAAAPGADRLPSLATLARYRARVERDTRFAEAQLDAARRRRPRLPAALAAAAGNARKLRWLAERAEEREAADARGAAEPEPSPVPDAELPRADDQAAPACREPGTDGPEAAPNRAQRRRLAALERLARRRDPV